MSQDKKRNAKKAQKEKKRREKKKLERSQAQQGKIATTTAAAASLASSALEIFEQGDINSAESLLRKAIKRYPSDPDVNFACAYFLGAQGKNEEAVGYLQKFLIAEPNCLTGRYNLVNAYFELGEIDLMYKHIQILRRSALSAPAEDLHFLELCSDLEKQANQTCLKVDGLELVAVLKHRKTLNQGMGLLLTEDLIKAEECFQEILDSKPPLKFLLNARHALSFCFGLQGRISEARIESKKNLKDDKNFKFSQALLEEIEELKEGDIPKDFQIGTPPPDPELKYLKTTYFS